MRRLLALAMLAAMLSAAAGDAFAYRFRNPSPSYGTRIRTPSYRIRMPSLTPRLRQPRIYTYRAPRLTTGVRMSRDPFPMRYRAPKMAKLPTVYGVQSLPKPRRPRVYAMPGPRFAPHGQFDMRTPRASPRVTLEPLHLLSQEPYSGRALRTPRTPRTPHAPRLLTAAKSPESKCRNSKGHWIKCSNLGRYP